MAPEPVDPTEQAKWPGVSPELSQRFIDHALSRNAFVKFMMQKMGEVGGRERCRLREDGFSMGLLGPLRWRRRLTTRSSLFFQT